ncbi:MAG: hypothetical protein QXO84_03545 [Candidatus Aenigmatarchaeota archaeon]
MNVKSIVMGFFRFMFSFLFLLSLSSFIVFWILRDFTSEETLKPLISDIVYARLSNFDKEMKYVNNTIEYQCKDKERFQLTVGDVQLSILCEEFRKSKDLKRFLSEQVANSFYECENEFCQKNYEIMLTRKSHLMLSTLTFITFSTSCVFGAATFIFTKGKVSRKIKTIAILILFACLPGVLTYFLLEPIKQKYISSSSEYDVVIQKLVEIATAKYTTAFFTSFVLMALFFVVWFFEKRSENMGVKKK